MKKRILTSLVLGSILFTATGCMSTYNKNELIREVQGSRTDLGEPILRGNYREVLQKQTFVSISTPKSVKQVLEELSKMKGQIYFLDKNSENIEVPVSDYKVRSFSSFREYLRSVTDYTLAITKNRYKKTLPKVVSLFQKSKIKHSLKRVPIKFWSNTGEGISASDALSIVAKETGFTVSVKQDDFINNKNLSSFLASTNINFRGRNVKDFLNYLENSYDLFVDVNYKKKIIYISKYKTKFFKLLAPNIELESSSNSDGQSSTQQSTTGGAGGVDSTSNTQSMQMDQSVKLKTYESIVEKLKVVFNNATDDKSPVYYNLNQQNGELIVKANRQLLEEASTLVKNFNDSYMNEFRLKVNVYEVLVNRDNSYGINAKDILRKFTGGQSFVFNTGGQVLQNNFLAIKNNAGSNTATTMIDALSEYGYVLSANGIDEIASNNVPIPLSLQTTSEYVSAITVDTQSTTGVTSQSVSNENSTISSGYSMTILPKITGENVYLQIDYAQNKRPDLVDRQIGQNSITLATNYNKTSFKKFKRLKLGDTRLFSIVQYDESDTYKGLLPIKDFIIGGSSAKKLVRREILVLVQALRKEQ